MSIKKIITSTQWCINKLDDLIGIFTRKHSQIIIRTLTRTETHT